RSRQVPGVSRRPAFQADRMPLLSRDGLNAGLHANIHISYRYLYLIWDAKLFPQMAKTKRRTYKSLARERQAEDTRRRIVAATRELLQTAGYARMTIEAIADQAEVSAPSVYAIFKSKVGILAELLDQSSYGADYDSAVQ